MSTVDRSADCRACGATTGSPFVWIPDQPVHCNLLWDDPEAARSAPRGDLDLVFCRACGHVFNRAFDPSLTEYGATYENSLHHSTTFATYADQLVDALIGRRDLSGRTVVEIGAGQGDFLELLCERSGARGIGFDPSSPSRRGERVELVASFLPEVALQPELVVCRHVLEHIDRCGEFLEHIGAQLVGPETQIFFEVPNAAWTFEHDGIWDLVYEHCGYFSASSLAALFNRSGFEVDRVQSVFGGQFLTVQAQRAAAPNGPAPALGHQSTVVAGFAETYFRTIETWRCRLDEWGDDGGRTMIWGAGSKGVTFLNMVDPGRVIAGAVDLNPRKCGRFVAGTGHPILAPEDLTDERPDRVIVMNPNYTDEIERSLLSLGLAPELITA